MVLDCFINVSFSRQKTAHKNDGGFDPFSYLVLYRYLQSSSKQIPYTTAIIR